MTITRYEPQWVGTDPKQLRAVIEGTQGICRVVLVDPMNRELVPRQFFGCAGLANYLSAPLSLMTAGMGGMDVRVRIDECNDSPTEVEDCRNRVNLGPIELLDSPPIDPTPGPRMPLMCSPRGMMLDTCTPECMARLATVRETRGAVVDACTLARDRQSTADALGIASAALLGAAAILVIIASQTTNPFAAAVLGVIAIILAVIGVALWIAQSFAQAAADERWSQLSAAQTRWQNSTVGVLTVCCPECVGDLLMRHECPR